MTNSYFLSPRIPERLEFRSNRTVNWRPAVRVSVEHLKQHHPVSLQLLEKHASVCPSCVATQLLNSNSKIFQFFPAVIAIHLKYTRQSLICLALYKTRGCHTILDEGGIMNSTVWY